MAKYSYIDQQGQNQFVEATDPNTAIATAPNRMATSGVQLEQPQQAQQTQTQIPTGNTYNAQTGMYSSGVDAVTLANAQKVSLPTPPATDPFAGVANATTTYTNGTIGGVQQQATTQGNQDQTYLNSLAGVEGIDQAAIRSSIETQNNLQTKADVARNIKAQIDAANAQAQASQLSLEGQGRGVPLGIIGGQQAKINRENAIRVMPLTAQYQAAIGDYNAAKDTVDTMYKATVDSKQQDRDYKIKQIEAQYAVANNAEKKQLDAAKEALLRQDKLDAAFEKQKEQALALAKDSNDFSTVSDIMRATDVNGLANAVRGIRQVSATGKSSSTTIGSTTYVAGENPAVDAWAKRIYDGNAKLTDIPATGAGGVTRSQVVAALEASGNDFTGKPTVTEMGMAAKSTAQDLLDKFTKGKGTTAVGASRFWFTPVAFPGTDKADFKNTFESLKSQLSLEGVKLLKGQGQVSDAERALLAQAVTKLNLSQSEEEFKKTLEGIISRLNGVKSGVPVDVSPDEKALLDAGYTQEQIDQLKKQ